MPSSPPQSTASAAPPDAGQSAAPSRAAPRKNLRQLAGRWGPALFFGLYLLCGLWTFRDYGLCPDEIINRENGRLAYRYVFYGDPALFQWRDRYYGTALEFVLYGLEKSLGLKDTRTILLFRHLAVFLLFWASTLVFFQLLKTCFRSRPIAMAGTLMLVLMPRIYAHSFYNPKDIGMLALYILASYTMIRFLRRPDFGRAFFHALACALLIDIRIAGILVPLVTVAFFLAGLLAGEDSAPLRKLPERLRRAAWLPLLGYGILLAAGVVAFWPVLWRAPLANFAAAFREMSRYPWKGAVLYLGKCISAQNLPWHYPLVWMGITIPPIYMLFIVLGLVPVARDALRRPLSCFRRHRELLAVLCLGAGPVLAVIVLHSCLYDAWRHLFFVYPALVAAGAAGLAAALDWAKRAPRRPQVRVRLVWTALVLQFAAVLAFMVRVHPYQNVYFNAFIPSMHQARRWFDVDYWGLSYPEGLRAIAQRDASPRIPVAIGYKKKAGQIYSLILPRKLRRRFTFPEHIARARYFLSTYRRHPQDFPLPHEIYARRIGGERIMVVYRLEPGESLRGVGPAPGPEKPRRKRK